MAVTKRRSTSTRKRRRKTTTTTPRKRRRRTTKPKGFLSEFMSPTEANAGFKATTSGLVGGGLFYGYHHLVEDNSPQWSSEVKNGIGVLAGFLIATKGKRPNTGAGMAGAAIFNYLGEQGFLNDNSTQMARMQYAQNLQNLPQTLSDDEMMYLAQQEQDMYLAQGQDNNNNMYLANQGGYQVSYAPNFAGTA